MTFQRLIRPLLFPALLLVGVASALRAQEAVTVAPGRSVTLTAEAGGTPPFTYQWFKNGASVAGATLVTYQIPVAAAADSGQYTVRVSNASGSTTSPAANIFVGTVPQITTHPAGQTVALNGAVSFSVVATGDPAPDSAPGAVGAAVVVAKPGGKAKKFADLAAYELKATFNAVNLPGDPALCQ